MLSTRSPLSTRAENLKNCLEREDLQVLSKIVESYIVTKDHSCLVLSKRFSKESVERVLQQLGETKFEVFVFPHGTTTRIEFH